MQFGFCVSLILTEIILSLLLEILKKTFFSDKY
jgi:hypothetical protein